MLKYKATVYKFGSKPELEFENGLLKGFDSDSLCETDYNTRRARILYGIINADTCDLEYVLGVLPNGKWAIIGSTIPGNEFAIEEEV